MKNTVGALAALGALAFIGVQPAHAQEIQVIVNGQPVVFTDTRPQMIQGRVLVPLRGVLEKMGAHVGWIQQTHTVVADKGNTDINLPIGSHTAQVNGNPVQLDVPAMIIGGSTLVPLRFVSESMGADVGWSNATETVTITMRDTLPPDEHFHENHQQPPIAIVPPAPPRDRIRNITVVHHIIQAGTVIPLRLNNDLSSRDNSVGDLFTLNVDPIQDAAGLPPGSTVTGVIREASPAHDGKPGMLDVDFQTIRLGDGHDRDRDRDRPIYGNVIDLNAKNLSHSGDGRLVAGGGKTTGDRVKWIGIGAGAGYVLGSITKGNRIVNTTLGGVAGLVFNETQNHKANDVKLRAGTRFGLRLIRDFSFDQVIR